MHYIRYLKNLILHCIYDLSDSLRPISRKLNGKIIGQTSRNKPIFCYRIGNGQKKILFLSGIHGNEIGTVKLAHHVIHWLDREITQYQGFTFFIIPCLNVDGFLLARQEKDYQHGGLIGRLNNNNVDLNRNFSTKNFQSKAFWNYGLNYKEIREVYAGPYGNSEPEIKILTNFITTEKIETIFSFHNAGKDITSSNDNDAQELAKIYSDTSGYRLMSEAEWRKLNQTGTLKEWCEENNIVYVEIETSNRYTSDWKRNKKAIKTLLELTNLQEEHKNSLPVVDTINPFSR